MKKINIDILEKGDIVLTTSQEKLSKLVKFATMSDISHAMICVSRASVMDSTNEGIQARNIQRMFFDDLSAIYIFRPNKPLSNEQLEQVISYVRSKTEHPMT